MCSWVFLKMFLVISRRLYILLALLLCTAKFFWKCSYLFWGESTYSSHYYYVQLSFSENVLSYSEETVHTSHITTMCSCVILKMSLFILMGQYILLTWLLCSGVILKIFLIILGRQYIVLTLLLFSSKFLFKCFILLGGISRLTT